MLRLVLPALVSVALLASGCGPGPIDETPAGSCKGRLAGDLVISEFMANPAGEDSGKEYLELYNATSEAISLNGIALRYSKPDGSSEKKVTLKEGTIAPGQYYVIGDVRNGAPLPGYMDATYADGLGAFANTSGKFGVLCGSTVLDEVTYSSVKDNTARIFDGSMAPDAAVNDNETRWCNAQSEAGGFFGSPRAANQSCQSLTCTGFDGDLVFTEIMPNPAGADEGGEYVELYNASGASMDLAGLTLKYTRLDGSAPKEVKLTNGTIASGKYFTLGDARTEPLPAHIDLSYGAGLGALGNTDGTLSISCGDTVLDSVSYTRMKENYARVFDGNVSPDAFSNDDESSWCDATTMAGTFFGSPRAANEACGGNMSTGCLDPVSGVTRELVAPTPGRLIVTEVMANPAGTDADREWIELYAFDTMDLNTLLISRDSQTGTSSTRTKLTSEECISVSSGSYVLLARNRDPAMNGGVSGAVSTFSFSLTDGASIFLSWGETLIDQGTYPKKTSDGVSEELSGDRLEAWVNDSAYAWCSGITPYGAGGKGTPGAANQTCPLPVAPGECADTGAGIARNINAPVVGDLAISEVMAAPSTTTAEFNKEWFEVAALASVDLNGIEVSNELGSKVTILQKECVTVAPGSYLLFKQTTDSVANGGLPATGLTFNFELANGVTTANPERAVILRAGGTELDRYTWTSTTVGASDQVSASVPLSPAANDVSANRCLTPAENTYGAGDRGTPGAANAACP